MFKDITVCPNLDGAMCSPVMGVLATIQPGPPGQAPPLSLFIYPFNKTSLKCLVAEAESKGMSLPVGDSLQ